MNQQFLEASFVESPYEDMMRTIYDFASSLHKKHQIFRLSFLIPLNTVRKVAGLFVAHYSAGENTDALLKMIRTKPDIFLQD